MAKYDVPQIERFVDDVIVDNDINTNIIDVCRAEEQALKLQKRISDTIRKVAKKAIIACLDDLTITAFPDHVAVYFGDGDSASLGFIERDVPWTEVVDQDDSEILIEAAETFEVLAKKLRARAKEIVERVVES